MSLNRKYLHLFQSQKNIVLNQLRSFEDFTLKSIQIQHEERKIIKFSRCCKKRNLKNYVLEIDEILSRFIICRTFCDCLLVLKNYTLQTRIPSTFMLEDKFSSNMFSPIKYISRPPSNEKNPESPEKTIDRFRSPNTYSQKITQSQTQKFAKFNEDHPKVSSFAGIIKNSRSQKCL